MKFCTFYTEGFYEEVANTYIIPSAKSIGITLYEAKVPSLKNWHRNSAMKAEIIFNFINDLNDDIVMIDADATFEQYPSLFDNIPSEYDMAVHFLDIDKFWRNQIGSSRRQLASGTIMFRNSLKTKQFIITWIEENSRNPRILEQQNLENILKTSNMKVFDLPVNYCAIVRKDNTVPSYIKDVVIKHHQISRVSKGVC